MPTPRTGRPRGANSLRNPLTVQLGSTDAKERAAGKEALKAALTAQDGNLTATAKALGCSTLTVSRLVKRAKLERFAAQLRAAAGIGGAR